MRHLGVNWNPNHDTMTFQVAEMPCEDRTASRIVDPFCWINSSLEALSTIKVDCWVNRKGWTYTLSDSIVERIDRIRYSRKVKASKLCFPTVPCNSSIL